MPTPPAGRQAGEEAPRHAHGGAPNGWKRHRPQPGGRHGGPEGEEEDGRGQVAHRQEPFLDGLAVRRAGQDQSHQERPDRLGHVEDFPRAGDSQDEGEHQEQEQLLGEIRQGPIQQAASRMARGDDPGDEQQREGGPGQQARRLDGAGQEDPGEGCQIDGQEHVLDRDDSQDQLGLGVRGATQVDEDAGHDGAGGDGHDAHQGQDLQTFPAQEKAVGGAEGRVQGDVCDPAHHDPLSRLQEPGDRQFEPDEQEEEQQADPSQQVHHRGIAHHAEVQEAQGEAVRPHQHPGRHEEGDGGGPEAPCQQSRQGEDGIDQSQLQDRGHHASPGWRPVIRVLKAESCPCLAATTSVSPSSSTVSGPGFGRLCPSRMMSMMLTPVRLRICSSPMDLPRAGAAGPIWNHSMAIP